MNSDKGVQTEEGLCPSSRGNRKLSAKAAMAVVAVALMMSAGALVFLASAETEAASDDEMIIGNYRYVANNDGVNTLTVLGFNPEYLKLIVANKGNATDIDIPGYVYGDDGTRYHVTTVGDQWAKDLGAMFVINIYIGEGVETIVNNAFNGIIVDVNSHYEIYIPPTTTYIGNKAFFIKDGYYGFCKIILDNIWVVDQPKIKFVGVFSAGSDDGIEVCEKEPNYSPDSPKIGGEEQPCYMSDLNGKLYILTMSMDKKYYFFDFSNETMFDCGDFKYKVTSAGAELIGFADGFVPSLEYKISVPNTVKDADDNEYIVSTVTAKFGKLIEKDYKGVVVTGISIGSNVNTIVSGAFEGIVVKEQIDLKLSSVRLGTNSFKIVLDESADISTSGIGSLTMSGMGIINQFAPSDVFGFEFYNGSGEEITSFSDINGKYVFEEGTFHPSTDSGGDGSDSTGMIAGILIGGILAIFFAAMAIVVFTRR